MQTHEQYIKECLKLARQGEGQVSPNPLVGSLVLDKNGEIVGKGYHQKYGEPHAEVNTLNMAGNKAKGGTIYVNLEPCSHHGKTPPCADRIIKEGLKKVVIGMQDPNPKVAGSGIKKLNDAGIEVVTDILEGECKKLNEIFIKNIKEKKSFIAVKTASTIDGKIAASSKSSKWITSEKARNKVQQLRNKYDAILTGSGTVLEDDPSLTCRMDNGRNPVRIIIDSTLKTSPTAKVYNQCGTQVWVAVADFIEDEKIKNYPKHINFIKCPLSNAKKIDLNYLTKKLYENNIYSIMIEAGGLLNGAFIKENLVDKLYLFVAPKILGDNAGLSIFDGFNINNIKKCINIEFKSIERLEPDLLLESYIK